MQPDMYQEAIAIQLLKLTDTLCTMLTADSPSLDVMARRLDRCLSLLSLAASETLILGEAARTNEHLKRIIGGSLAFGGDFRAEDVDVKEPEHVD